MRVSITPSRSTLTSAVACWKGMRSCKRAVWPGSTSRFSGSRSMRSSLSCANHQGSSLVIQADPTVVLARPASSFTVARSSTSPLTSSGLLHARRPCASVLPLHSTPSSFCSERLSYV